MKIRQAPKALRVVAVMLLFEGMVTLGSRLAESRFPGAQVNDIVFSQDGQTVYGVGGESLSDTNNYGWWWAWDTSTGRLRWKKPLQEPVYTVQLSPKGSTLLTQSETHALILWDAATGRRRRKLEERPVRGTVGKTYFTPDEQRVMGCFDEGVHVWNTHTGKREAFWWHPKGEYGWVDSLEFSTDGTKVLVKVSGWSSEKHQDPYDSACIYLRDSKTGRVLRRLPGASKVSALSPASDKIAVIENHYDAGDAYYRVIVYGVKPNTGKRQSPRFPIDFSPESLEFRPDGNILCKGYSGRSDESLQQQAFLWNVKKSTLTPKRAAPNDTSDTVLSPDKRVKAMANQGGYQNRPPLGTLYNALTGKKLSDLEGRAGR